MQPPQKQKQAVDSGDAVERLGRDLAALAGPDWQRLHYGVAVSGGPDSMAMLALAHRAFLGGVIAATVDHRLRADAADEAFGA